MKVMNLIKHEILLLSGRAEGVITCWSENAVMYSLQMMKRIGSACSVDEREHT
jgi:hypothetical protein